MRYEKYLKSLKGGKQLEIEIKKMLENADVAQLVEHLHGKEVVSGSNPLIGSDNKPIDNG